MPAVRTDYLTPMSRTYGAIGQGIANVGQVVGEAFARYPEESRKQEEWDRMMEKFKNEKEFRIGEIENVHAQAKEFADKVKMPPKQYDQMNAYFENIKKADGPTAIEKLGNISYYLTNYADQFKYADDTKDQALENITEMDMTMAFDPALWDDEKELKSIGDRLMKARKDRQSSLVHDWIAQNAPQDKNATVDRITLKGKFADAMQGKPNVDYDAANKIIDDYAESRKDVEQRNLDWYNARTGRMKAERTGGGVGGGSAKNNREQDIYLSLNNLYKGSLSGQTKIWQNVMPGFINEVKQQNLDGKYGNDALLFEKARDVFTVKDKIGDPNMEFINALDLGRELASYQRSGWDWKKLKSDVAKKYVMLQNEEKESTRTLGAGTEGSAGGQGGAGGSIVQQPQPQTAVSETTRAGGVSPAPQEAAPMSDKEREVRDNLKQKGLPPEKIEGYIQHLKNQGKL